MKYKFFLSIVILLGAVGGAIAHKARINAIHIYIKPSATAACNIGVTNLFALTTAISAPIWSYATVPTTNTICPFRARLITTVE